MGIFTLIHNKLAVSNINFSGLINFYSSIKITYAFWTSCNLEFLQGFNYFDAL